MQRSFGIKTGSNRLTSVPKSPNTVIFVPHVCVLELIQTEPRSRPKKYGDEQFHRIFATDFCTVSHPSAIPTPSLTQLGQSRVGVPLQREPVRVCTWPCCFPAKAGGRFAVLVCLAQWGRRQPCVSHRVPCAWRSQVSLFLRAAVSQSVYTVSGTAD